MWRRSSWESVWSTYQSVSVLGWGTWGTRKVTGQATLQPLKISAILQNCLWPQWELRPRLMYNDYQVLRLKWDSPDQDWTMIVQKDRHIHMSRKSENADGIITKTQILLYPLWSHAIGMMKGILRESRNFYLKELEHCYLKHLSKWPDRAWIGFRYGYPH